ncbi:hypothetical protein VTK26DRAFT_6150 [Humicola hyalothermophila]
MAHTRAQTAAQRALPLPASDYQGNRPHGIRPCKGSSRKRATRRFKRNRLRPATPSETPTAPVQSRGCKRKQSIEHALEASLDPDPDPDPKRRRTSPPRPAEDAFCEPAIGSSAHEYTDPVDFWAEKLHWPPEQDWPEETSTTDFTIDSRILARRKSSSNLSRKRSNSATSTTPSDQKPREEKSALYRQRSYKTLLATKGSFMDESPLGITEESKGTYVVLLESDQTIPNDTLFRDDLFKQTCRRVEDRNEARIIWDITPLIVPRAEILATYGATQLKCLIESANEGWNISVPLTKPRP